MTVFDRLCEKLNANNVDYKIDHHAPVRTSEEAAQVRGVPMASGAKALVVKTDESFTLFVMPANRRLDSKGLKKRLKLKSIRFANAEEVQTHVKLVPGSIPPFGSLFGFVTIADPALKANEIINFNAADLAISISMRCEDYASCEQPRWEENSLAPEIA
jgi:Ala-tRNA(Pro) deacylase